ncbi:restriction endonuclease subunit S, partial [Streptomyces sp. P17]|uniref:restriction endonuclease subunit S n=1 Tax=Streptomyces sp. P17 TaxID=3074716 RepID=UPI0028F3E6B4
FFLPEGQKYLHNQRLGLIRVQANEHLVDRYLHYYLSLPDTRRIISAESTGTKVKHTSPERLYDINISLPSLLEQRKIVESLRTWD